MFAFVRRVFTLAREQEAEAPELEAGVEHQAVSEAIKIIEEHLDREALNRRLQQLAPRELCPDQRTELVNDLAKLLK